MASTTGERVEDKPRIYRTALSFSKEAVLLVSLFVLYVRHSHLRDSPILSNSFAFCILHKQKILLSKQGLLCTTILNDRIILPAKWISAHIPSMNVQKNISRNYFKSKFVLAEQSLTPSGYHCSASKWSHTLKDAATCSYILQHIPSIHQFSSFLYNITSKITTVNIHLWSCRAIGLLFYQARSSSLQLLPTWFYKDIHPSAFKFQWWSGARYVINFDSHRLSFRCRPLL